MVIGVIHLLHWTIQDYFEAVGLVGAAAIAAATIYSYVKGFVYYGYNWPYTKIYRKDNPTKYWLLFGAQIFGGILLLALGIFCAVTDRTYFQANFHR